MILDDYMTLPDGDLRIILKPRQGVTFIEPDLVTEPLAPLGAKCVPSQSPQFTLRSYGASQHFGESGAINISLLTELFGSLETFLNPVRGAMFIELGVH